MWTFGNGQIPHRGWLIAQQRDRECALGIKRTLLYFPEDLDLWMTVMRYAKEITGQPIAVEGHPPDNYDDFHIAAFIWSNYEKKWVVFDTRVPGGKLVTDDEGLNCWVNDVFNIATLQYFHVHC